MKKEELRMKNCRVADAAKLRKRCAPEDGGRTRARVVCVPVGTRHTHTGIINNTSSYHAQAHAHARRPFSEAEISAWRERIFANSSEDPVRVAVAEAVKDFGRPEDFTIWAWYCNRIGVNNFLELYFEQKSIMEKSCFPLRNPAAAFHARLKRFLNAMQIRGQVPVVRGQ